MTFLGWRPRKKPDILIEQKGTKVNWALWSLPSQSCWFYLNLRAYGNQNFFCFEQCFARIGHNYWFLSMTCHRLFVALGGIAIRLGSQEFSKKSFGLPSHPMSPMLSVKQCKMMKPIIGTTNRFLQICPIKTSDLSCLTHMIYPMNVSLYHEPNDQNAWNLRH